MSENHYSHPQIPTPVYNLSHDTSKQRNDFCRLPNSANQQWSAGPSNEFGNREEYMETQLTEENYNNCGLDSNANQNEVVDDEPYPPPGLRRLVTGQTVSFDDGPSSPPFDRVVPGEGNTFNNYPQPNRIPKMAADPYPDSVAISERYVSGSTSKEYASLPQQSFVAIKKVNMNSHNNSTFIGSQSAKKDDMNIAGNNNYYNADSTINLSTQDFFDTYLHDGNPTHNENVLKSNQYSKNYPSMPGSFSNSDTNKRDNYFQLEKPINALKPLQNDDFSKEHVIPTFPINFQSRASHLPQDKVIKSLENSHFTNVEKPLDTHLSNRRASMENFTHEQPPMVTSYDNTYSQKVNSQNYDASFQVYEPNSSEKNNAHFNQNDQLTGKINQENFNNQEDDFGNRDLIKKESAHLDVIFSDQRRLGNVTMEASLAVDPGKESNLKSPYRKSSTTGGEERIDNDVSLERGKVPGAQSTPNDNQSIRSFQNANNSTYNNSHIFKVIEDEDEREENVQGTDSDEKSLGRRMVLGYNSNTLPDTRSSSQKMPLDSKLNKPYQFDSSFNKSNKIEPLEQRMVVGEGGGMIPSKNKTSSGSRYNRDRKKQLYDRMEHHTVESDDEDYEELGDRTYDNSPDRESRSYHDKFYRNSSPHRNDKRSYGRNRDSFTQSQDESYFDDDDDDYDTFRNQRRYYGRRYPREPVYKQYDHDPRYRDERYRGRRDYYNRYEEDSYYRDGRNSRPSSRSGSEYRREFMEYPNPRYYNRLPYYEHLDHRYIVSYGGEPRLSKKEIEYWSKVREIDPPKYMNWFKVTFVQEYKEWYLKYVSHKNIQSGSTYQADRRGSGHSGQSSVNNDVIGNDEKILDINREESLFKPVESNTTYEIRCTPLKFSIPHAKGKFGPLNQLLIINPCSPRDGQRAEIDLGRALPQEQDFDYIELLKFSGPCIVGETHVNTVSNYLRDLTNNTSHSSEKLLYQMIDLIIKLRGVTDGIAISELLTDNYHKSQAVNAEPLKDETNSAENHQSLSETELIEKFYHLYFQGNRNEALDLALNNQMWGQALIAGFTMGPKYHSRVLAEFFSIPINSPLKTAYQFYSKQIPEAVMACSDEKWSDWRIHLAVMLSYPTSDPDFNKQAIITLGDSLSNKDVFASHCCYLAAHADFGTPTKSSTKYTLLTLRNVAECFDNPPSRAILLTQIYEFAKRLQRKDFVINSLLPYKLLLVVRLISYRNFSAALQYLESIALDIIENPSNYDHDQINDVIELSEKIKYSNGKFLNADSFNEKQWLIDLRQIANLNYNETVSHAASLNDQSSSHIDAKLQCPDQSFSHQQQPILMQPSYNQPQSFPSNEIQQQPVFFNPSLPINQSMSLPPSFPPINQQPPERRPSQPWESDFNAQEHTNNYPQQESFKNGNALNNSEYLKSNESNASMNNRFDEPEVVNNEQGYWEPPQQTITMPSKSKNNYFNSEEDRKTLTQDTSHNHRKDSNQAPQLTHKSVDRNMKKEAKNDNNNNGNNNSGWLGGIFGKLSLRPKNEMKLPDDKNPSIVWNEEKKRWVNVNGDDDDDVAKITPPPRASEVQNFQPQITPNQMPRPGETPVPSNLSADTNKPPMQSSTNMYKLSRGKGMKANYVNVLSHSMTPSTNVPPPGPVMDSYSKPQMIPNMNLLVPSADGVTNTMLGDPSVNCNLSDKGQIRNPPRFYNPDVLREF